MGELILTPKWSSSILRSEPAFLSICCDYLNYRKGEGLSRRQSKGNARLILRWSRILSPIRFMIDIDFLRMQSFEALPSLKKRSRRSSLARMPRFQSMILDFYGLILRRVRLKERPVKRDLRLEARDLASSEKLLERSGPLPFDRFSAV